jgi:hypothetical protein
MHTRDVPDDLDREAPHLQWATDPAGRRYWIQGGPSYGGNPLTGLIKAFFSRERRPPHIEVGGVVMVTRVEGEQRIEVFEWHCSTLEEARAKAISLAGEIEAGTFQEQTHGA